MLDFLITLASACGLTVEWGDNAGKHYRPVFFFNDKNENVLIVESYEHGYYPNEGKNKERIDFSFPKNPTKSRTFWTKPTISDLVDVLVDTGLNREVVENFLS